jgi:outer membrane immunogenic protein
MKKTIMALAMAATTAGAAAAADLPRNSAPYFAPAATGFNWSGAYVGANLGYSWGKVTNSNTSPSGIEGGVQGGYNWQSGQFVYGAETDLQLSGSEDTFAPFKFSNPWFGTLRGRGGFAYSNFLFYLTGGLAYGSVKAESAFLSESRTQLGWTVGLGGEMGITTNWSAKVEYLYMDLGSRNYTVTGTSNAFHDNILRVGLNYHF